MFILAISCLTTFTLIHGPNIPCSYAIFLLQHWTLLPWSITSTTGRCSHFYFCPFHHRVLECKSRKSRDTWSKFSKFGLGVQNEAGQRLKEFCQENALVIVNILFQQHKRRLYTGTSPDGQYRNQMDYIICSQRWRSETTKSVKTILGANCDSDHEFLIAKFTFKLKKVGKPTRPFRYDLN